MRAALIWICTLFFVFTIGSATVGQRPVAAPASPGPDHSGSHQSLKYLRQRGVAFAKNGEYGKAYAILNEGYRRSLKAGDSGYTTRFLINLANVQFKLHHYTDAMRTYLEAGDRARIEHNRELQAVLLTNVSWLYTVMGAYPEAMRTIEKAIRLLPHPERSPFLPRMLAQKATLYSRVGQISNAGVFLRRAFLEADRRGDVAAQIAMLDAFGRDLLEYGSLQSADSVLTEAFRLRRSTRRRVNDLCYRNLAMLRLAQHELKSAGILIHLAFQAARKYGNTAPIWSLYYVRGSIRQARGRPREALADYRESLRKIQDLRLDLLPADSIRMSAGVGLQPVYDAFIHTANHLYFETGRTRFARLSWEAAEQHRAAALRESLRESEQLRNRLPAAYWETLRRLGRAEVSLFRRNTPATRRRVERLRQHLTELEYREGLDHGGHRHSPDSLSLTGTQRLLRPSEVLLSFYLAEPHSFLWAVTSNHIELHRLPARSRLEHLAAAFRRAVERSSSQRYSLGHELYAALFGGLRPPVLHRREWCLLLDGTLFELPFPALVTTLASPRPRYLVQEHSLRVIPGAGTLSGRPISPWRGPLLTVSDPIYNRADPRWRSVAPRRPSLWARFWNAVTGEPVGAEDPPGVELARLPGTAREVRACAKYFPSPLPVMLSGRNANVRELAAALASKPSIIHIATHVLPAPDEPRTGHIVLSLQAGGTPELLGPALISALRVHSGLVVMSGCSSGSGKVLPGEGLLGLSRAWLRAGAGSVVGTLWPVADNSGTLLCAFYRRLGGVGVRGFLRAPWEALRLAQLEMLHSASSRSRPAYWAAYFMVSRN